MKLVEITGYLRKTSKAYGGIKNYLEAAGELDKAVSAFFKEQDRDTLRDLNAAFSYALRLQKESKAEDAKEPHLA